MLSPAIHEELARIREADLARALRRPPAPPRVPWRRLRAFFAAVHGTEPANTSARPPEGTESRRWEGMTPRASA